MKKQAKFGIGIGIIVVSMASLAWLGYGESKTYYHTLAELDTLKGAATKQHMRVGGTVQAGSIHRMAGRVDFVLEGEGKMRASGFCAGRRRQGASSELRRRRPAARYFCGQVTSADRGQTDG